MSITLGCVGAQWWKAYEVDDDRAQTRDRTNKPTRRSHVTRRDLIEPGGPTSEVDGVANDRARQCSAHRQGDEWDQRVDKGRAKDTPCALVTCLAPHLLAPDSRWTPRGARLDSLMSAHRLSAETSRLLTHGG